MFHYMALAIEDIELLFYITTTCFTNKKMTHLMHTFSHPILAAIQTDIRVYSRLNLTIWNTVQ